MTSNNGRMNLTSGGDPLEGHSVPKSPRLATSAEGRVGETAIRPAGDHPVPDVDAPIHVAPCDDGWHLKFEGTEVVAAVLRTKAEAMAAAKALATERDVRIVEHGADGKIR